jgi:hypothetical protein
MALGLTQLLTEMSTRNLPGDKVRPALKADNHTAICDLTVHKKWDPENNVPNGPPGPLKGIVLFCMHFKLNKIP